MVLRCARASRARELRYEIVCALFLKTPAHHCLSAIGEARDE